MSRDPGRPLILAAADDPRFLDALREHLGGFQCDLILATDGEEALVLARERHPDLLLLGATMPRLTGWQVCHRIRQDPSLQDTGVIIFTAIGQTLTEMTAELFGADDRIDKPVSFEELDFKVRKVLASRRRDRLHRARNDKAMATRSGRPL